jgi:hypothetical protein
MRASLCVNLPCSGPARSGPSGPGNGMLAHVQVCVLKCARAQVSRERGVHALCLSLGLSVCLHDCLSVSLLLGLTVSLSLACSRVITQHLNFRLHIGPGSDQPVHYRSVTILSRNVEGGGSVLRDESGAGAQETVRGAHPAPGKGLSSSAILCGRAEVLSTQECLRRRGRSRVSVAPMP